MAIPDYQALMLPLLRVANDGQEHSIRQTIEQLAAEFQLSDEERRDLLPSGQQPTFDNRAHWARSYLKQAGLLSSPKRGYFKITPRGQDVLAQGISSINVEFLGQFEEFQEFRKRKRKGSGKDDSGGTTRHKEEATPEETFEAAYQDVRDDLAHEILQQVRDCSPAFFERLVVDLLVKMGYGGTRRDAGEAIGGSGDGGIDGIIKEDRLGLDIVYIQAKKWENPVGRPEIQKFAGALQGQRARKGVFITTSAFTKEAQHFSTSIDSKVILIDGEALGQYMIDFGIGVSTFATYDLKRIDADYFSD